MLDKYHQRCQAVMAWYMHEWVKYDMFLTSLTWEIAYHAMLAIYQYLSTSSIFSNSRRIRK